MPNLGKFEGEANLYKIASVTCPFLELDQHPLALISLSQIYQQPPSSFVMVGICTTFGVFIYS